MDALDLAMQWLAYPVGGGIFLNQLDELFMDANYLFRGLHRRSRRVVSAEALRSVKQKRIAILLPAWKESDVIEQMVEHNLAAIDYGAKNYDIFVGTYQNDPDTQACVARLARRFRSVHKVAVPHDGPTCKADCLNWVYQGVVLEERRRRSRFDILLMHDAEDIIHPLALRLYSLLIPRYEFVQTPVFSLELKLGQVVAGTYIDEFAEHHLKDMKVRHALGGLVPSAGVGSAFDRQAFEEIARSHGQQPFDTSSLTEDYEIGLKFRLAGKRVSFACYTVEYDVPDPRGSPDKACGPTVDGLPSAASAKREEYIATREYFPAGVNASVRQRSRWILGITLQAWEQTGWKGPLPVLYCMWRDRKGLLNNLLMLLAYVFFVYVLGRTAIAALTGSPWQVADLVPPGGILHLLLAVNLGTLLWRGSVKLHFVRNLYGLAQGILTFPRLVVGNVISIAATTRAIGMYVHHRVTGQPLRWFKTAHAFPSPELLHARRLLLGELLLERAAVAPTDLDVALSLQRRLKLPLGRILIISGVLPERRVVPCLAEHFEMRAQHPDPAKVSLSLLSKLSEVEAEEMDVLPLWDGEDATAVVAVTRPLSDEERDRLERRLGSRVETVLSMRRALQRARSVVYRRLYGLAPSGRLLGERLVDAGALDPRELPEVLEEQLETGEMLGEILLRKGLVEVAALDEAFKAEGGFVRVEMGDGDPRAVDRLSYGFCAFHSVVPLRQVRRATRRVATAYPLHAQVRAVLVERLGEPIEPVLAPRLDIRLALARTTHGAAACASARRRMGGDPTHGGMAVRRHQLRGSGLLTAVPSADAAEPIHSQTAVGIDPESAAEAQAKVLGIPLDRIAIGRVHRGLPPGIVRRHAIRIREATAGSMVLAAPTPSASLAREVAYLLPGWRIAWQVAAHPSPVKECQ